MVDPWSLIDTCAEIAGLADVIDQHIKDGTDHEAVAVLAVAISEARQQLAEVEKRSQEHLISVLPRSLDKKTGELRLAKEYVIPGLSAPVTTKRSPRRTEWRNDDLWNEVLNSTALCRSDIADQIDDLRAALSLGWSLTGLRALGIDPDDYCKADPAHESVQLPKRSMEQRGKSAAKPMPRDDESEAA